MRNVRAVEYRHVRGEPREAVQAVLGHRVVGPRRDQKPAGGRGTENAAEQFHRLERRVVMVGQIAREEHEVDLFVHGIFHRAGERLARLAAPYGALLRFHRRKRAVEEHVPEVQDFDRRFLSHDDHLPFLLMLS